MNVIEIENLCHRFADGTVGLDGISLDIRPGAFVVIAGPNGSGKTTLLRHLNALLLPTEGCVRIAGVCTSRDPVRARRLVGMMFQNADSQIVGETVYEDVAFGPRNLRLDPGEIDRRVAAALQAVELAQISEQRPHLLSGGEKRRLAIAGVLVMQPRVIVFDEPFASLDYPGVRQVLKQILALQGSGHTIVVATHDLEKVIAHAERLVLMHRGRVVRDGPPAEVMTEVENYGVRQPCAVRLGREITPWLS